MKLFASALLLAVGGAAAAFEPCGQQAVFDVMMCNSHMCNECALEWCMTSCQDLQMKNPGCRCEAWPETRKTFSGGDFEGKGKVGDAGDYSKDKAL